MLEYMAYLVTEILFTYGFKKVIAFCVLVFCLMACIVAVDSEESEIGKLPYCGPENADSYNQRQVFVSTLDGKLSALDAVGGSMSWSINTGPGPMLSSSIHRLELTNNGQWVRMIPSLNGGIYKFNGTSIEPIPLSADILLKSAPFTFSSELAMSGGRETRTYGVVAKTGQVVYECTMEGCTNSTDSFAADDIVIIQRQTQTVRAIEARTGIERWNFSVGQHDVNFVSDTINDCHMKRTPNNFLDEHELKVIVPEGLVCSVNKKTGEIVWKHKFDAPVVAAWNLFQGEMSSLDLFTGAQWIPSYNDELGPITPSLYIGMHNRQLYIQESVTLHERLGKMSTELVTTVPSDVPQIPWAPVPATALAAVTRVDSEPDSTELGYTELTTIARSFLYASEYVNGNGYYLFTTTNLRCDAGEKGNSTITNDDEEEEEEEKDPFDDYVEDDGPFMITYWKEISALVFSCVIVFNVMFTDRVLRAINILPFTNREIMQQEIIVVEKPVPVIVDHDNIQAQRSNSEPFPHSSQEFVSRYLTDFVPVHCLGRGGFGVVFEAKNKIDDCHYAIKRIPLPNRQESRDRVMREVKALAKLDHHNIVRYFNAWLECPPSGWQEEQDKHVPNCNDFCSLGENASLDYTSRPDEVTESKPAEACSSVFLNLGSESESENINKLKQIPAHTTEQSDSFIVFEDSRGKESELNLNGEDEHVTENKAEIKSYENTETSENCVSAWGEETKRKRTYSTKECHEEKKKFGHRRPLSLDLSSGGGVILPKVSRMYLYIQMQLCQRASLREWLRDSRKSCEVIHIFEQIVQAVEYVHLQGLIHRDLKPSNIFFSMNGEIKVGDFGLVTELVETTVQRTPNPEVNYAISAKGTHTARVGTQLYMSPEQAHGLPYNYKVDIYSLGIILFELLVPFKTAMERSCTLMDLRNNKFPQHFQDKFPQEYELLQMMLSHSPEKRPTTIGIRAHPPLKKDNNETDLDNRWYFDLPPLKRELSKTSSVSTSSSSESWENI